MTDEIEARLRAATRGQYAVGDAVEVLGKRSREWHRGTVTQIDGSIVYTELGSTDEGEILARELPFDGGLIRHVGAWSDVERLLQRVRELEAELALANRIGWGVVANAGRMSARRMVRWGHVRDAIGMGSTSSAELCRKHGFDPSEQVGPMDEDENAEDAEKPR